MLWTVSLRLVHPSFLIRMPLGWQRLHCHCKSALQPCGGQKELLGSYHDSLSVSSLPERAQQAAVAGVNDSGEG